jgi:hypothetical protein
VSIVGPLIFPEQEIEHPTTADVFAGLTAVVQDVGVIATIILQSVSEDGEAK